MCFDMHQSDKLSIFVDDMKRLGVSILPPAINKSRPNFSVEEQPEALLAVRYALAGLKNVGEKAMQAVVAERSEKGPFSSIEDFADRIDPHGLNKRQIESLASAGAFDELEPNRAAIFDGADTILSVANSAADARESGQGGLFGEGSAGGEMQAIRLPEESNWSLSEIMVHERDAFGFYFSAHPVSQFQAVTASLGARTFAALCSEDPIREGVRKPAVMAALVEKLRWRDSRRGKRFALVDLSDSSGQFSASCFEEDQCKVLEELADQGSCALLNVELDQQSDDENPRVAIRRVQPLDGLEKTTRTRMELEVHDIAGLHEMANLVAPLVGGQSEMVAIMAGPDGNLVKVCLGRSFRLDAETVEMLERVNGIGKVRLGPARPMRVAKPKLRLVS